MSKHQIALAINAVSSEGVTGSCSSQGRLPGGRAGAPRLRVRPGGGGRGEGVVGLRGGAGAKLPAAHSGQDLPLRP